MSHLSVQQPRSRSRPVRQLALFSIHSTIFLSLISFRILNAVTVRTFFQPDEYFQSLEPAWNLAFGSGGWLTWEWRHSLRSIAHPMIFAGLYRAVSYVCNAFNISPDKQAEALAVAPRILQALFAAMGDWATARLAGVLWGSDVGWISLWISLGSAWQWFCGTRTFVNSLETVVTALALSIWPWAWTTGDRSIPRPIRSEVRFSLLLAAFACILRPTNLLVWGFLGTFAFWNSGRKRSMLVAEALWIGASVLLANALFDRACYGEWTFPPLTFLKFNVLHSLSVFYGRNDWHYYLSQGLPLLLTSYLPLTLYALYTSLRHGSSLYPDFQLAATVSGVAGIYSLIAHKEGRFIYPLLPMLHVLAAKALQELNWSSTTKNRVLVGMILLNLPIAYYTSLVHQRGVIDVMQHLGTTSSEWSSAGFLMPCHSTPWRSFMGDAFAGKEMWALTCEPPVDVPASERDNYVDEADEFYKDPQSFVGRYFGEQKRYTWPDRLVVFESLIKNSGQIWGDDGYRECWRGFNSHLHDDWRRKGDVVVFCLKDQQPHDVDGGVMKEAREGEEVM
ncbi:Alg9-like mannosyltransferase family-domain-containing protein [Sphaerosporella brunnea]|uniref:Mannosyltransferase n=1 Tax=Sphaerosporella brunnea TaxID=1250544 RepID=A0A5J5ELW6_9PEZI|nr:Alg9-like mannosyltransferase family-domain-containing protein [Sphaerosporella brunnea]